MNANNPTPTRQRTPRSKPARTIRLWVRPSDERAGVIRIVVGQQVQDYVLEILLTDYGRGFCLKKVGYQSPTPYHVNIDGAERSCDCPGFTQHNHCKHSDGLTALIAAGRL
jgi:hypothetical protein